MDEFEKRLTAVHTRGLENVESPEMDEENQKEGASPEKSVAHTPTTSRGRARPRRGARASILVPSMQIYIVRYFTVIVIIFLESFFFFLFPGQAKPSVSSRSDDLVTPHKSKKSKKAMIMTFSSEEEEDEEGEGKRLSG